MPLLILLLLMPLLTWGNPVATENVTARLLAEATPVVPGQSANLLLVLEIRPGWHTYWQNPGDSGEAPRIDWTLPAGVEAGELSFPYPELIRVGPLANFGYSGRALHPVSLRIPADWPKGEAVAVRAEAHWLVCEEHCVPEAATLDLTLPTAADPGPPDQGAQEAFAAARGGLPQGVIEAVTWTESAAGWTLSLSVEALGPGPAEVRFFPLAWGLIEHAADQPWRLVGGLLEVDLVPGVSADQVDRAGVLVVRGADGLVRSFQVAPALGQPPAPGRGAGPPLGLPLALGFAFLGGLILNLMPCVFPVLAIKALSLVGQGGSGPMDRALHGLAYTAGVMVFFAGLAGLLLALRASGTAVGWGFQLQYPPFVAGMAYLFLVLGLSLAGAVTLGGRVMGLAGGPSGAGAAGAFGTGALAALVAAPCTAPFMGVALGYAVTLPWPQALAILLSLGLGLAAPFLLLSFAPALARSLPRPGPWMEGLKQFLAFPLFATAAWLVWVLSVQAGPAGVALVLSGMLLLTFGLWLRERTSMGGRGLSRVGAGAALLGLAGALFLAAHSDGVAFQDGVPAGGLSAGQPSLAGQVSEPYSRERLEAALSLGRPVFVNMTAAWCITCLVNERVALGTEAVSAAFAQAQVLTLKGDWTNRDPAITDYLAGFGRTGVPLYVLYRPGLEPLILPQILTPSILQQALGPAGTPNPL
jgi:thiol:disulfide interchange protein DsbD